MSKSEGPGTVAVLFSSEAARYSAFTSDLALLELPPGSVKDFEFGTDTREARNELVERAIERGSYWIWFISEDHSFGSDIVSLLLAREKQIMAPIVLSTRVAVHRPRPIPGVSRSGERGSTQPQRGNGPGDSDRDRLGRRVRDADQASRLRRASRGRGSRTRSRRVELLRARSRTQLPRLPRYRRTARESLHSLDVPDPQGRALGAQRCGRQRSRAERSH